MLEVTPAVTQWASRPLRTGCCGITDEGTFVFAHDDIANTLSSPGASYEKWPLKRQRAKIDQFIADHFTPEWSVTVKRLEVGRWIIYYRGELERVKLTDGSYELRITGDVLTIDGETVRIGSDFRVAEDGSGSLALFGAGKTFQVSDLKQREQFLKMSQPK